MGSMALYEAIHQSTPPRRDVGLGGKNDAIRDGFIRLSSLTHDTFVATQHTCMKRLGEDLQSAAKAAWPRQEGIRYSRVCVVLLSWVTDDLGVSSEIQRLRHVFEDMYYFQVQTYQIPDEKPDRALKGRILEFLLNDQDNSLLIFYYAGHARRGPQSNEGPLWFPNRQNPLITVPSSGIQTLLEEADSDVLLLYDCCHSAAIATTGCYQGNKGAKEVIAACGYETITPEVDQHSFTNALIETLALASKGTSFSVGELHSRVLSRLKCWMASLLYDDDGKILETPDGKIIQERQPRRTPIYSILRESTPRRSIVLAPLAPVQPRPAEEQQTIQKIKAAQQDVGGNFETSKGSRKRKRTTAEEPEWPQIVVSVRLDEAKFEIPTWRQWILSLPTEAKDIKIEGLYQSFSTLLLLRIPVALWNLFPDNGAYNFVGYVTSENLAGLQGIETRSLSEEIAFDEAIPVDTSEDPSKQVSSEYHQPGVVPSSGVSNFAQSGYEDKEVSSGMTNSRHSSPMQEQNPASNSATRRSSSVAATWGTPRENQGYTAPYSTPINLEDEEELYPQTTGHQSPSEAGSIQDLPSPSPPLSSLHGPRATMDTDSVRVYSPDRFYADKLVDEDFDGYELLDELERLTKGTEFEDEDERKRKRRRKSRRSRRRTQPWEGDRDRDKRDRGGGGDRSSFGITVG